MCTTLLIEFYKYIEVILRFLYAVEYFYFIEKLWNLVCY